MDIVLVNQSTGYLMVDIVNAYADKYQNVTLLTGDIQEFERKLSDKIRIEKIKKYDRSSIGGRIWSWAVAFIQIISRIARHHKGAYIVYVTNPPISYWTALINRNPSSILVYDIYPEALNNIGLSDKNPISKIWKSLNRKLFKKADYIYTLSDGMKKQLSQYGNSEKIRVIYNWSSVSEKIMIPKSDNPFIMNNKLLDKFVVMYSGNIGYTHNVEVILELALRLREEDSIQFVIIGDGGKKKDLLDIARLNNLRNCTFLDWQPAKTLRYSLAAADISIVTLTEETALVSVPSKTYNILSSGSPLLCIAPKCSEIARLVRDEQCGISYEKSEVDKMCAFLRNIRSNKLEYEMMRNNAWRTSKKYTYANAKDYVI